MRLRLFDFWTFRSHQKKFRDQDNVLAFRPLLFLCVPHPTINCENNCLQYEKICSTSYMNNICDPGATSGIVSKIIRWVAPHFMLQLLHNRCTRPEHACTVSWNFSFHVSWNCSFHVNMTTSLLICFDHIRNSGVCMFGMQRPHHLREPERFEHFNVTVQSCSMDELDGTFRCCHNCTRCMSSRSFPCARMWWPQGSHHSLSIRRSCRQQWPFTLQTTAHITKSLLSWNWCSVCDRKCHG